MYEYQTPILLVSSWKTELSVILIKEGHFKAHLVQLSRLGTQIYQSFDEFFFEEDFVELSKVCKSLSACS